MLVELFQQLPNGLVEFRQREEPAVAQRRYDPALSDLHADFDFRLIAGLAGTCG